MNWRLGIVYVGVLFCTGVFQDINAQTHDENIEKYWNYRDRYKKFFVRLEGGVGGGIPMANRNVNFDCSGPGTHQLSGSGIVAWGDGGIRLGYYLSVLATEYKLLNDNGQNVQPTLNELYYAISAVDRLDDLAERYLSRINTFPATRNGFFIRDDVPQNYYRFWENDPVASFKCVDGSAFAIDDVTYPQHYNVQSSESQDQVISLLMGLALVKKCVDNVFVKPTPSDAGFFMVDEAKAITDRILNYIIQEQLMKQSTKTIKIRIPTFKIGPSGQPSLTYIIVEDNFILKEYGNWVITDPVLGGLVPRGADARGFSYGLSQAGKFITGKNYGIPITYRQEHHNAIYPKLNAFVPLGVIQAGWEQLSKYDLPSLTKYEICATELIKIDPLNPCFSLEGVFKDDNMHMILSLAATGGSWEHNNITRNARSARMPHFDLLYSILHDEAPLISKSEYEQILNTAPCAGPNSDDPNGWHVASRWEHPASALGSQDAINSGEYNGNDYMLLYNMYHLAFKDQLPVYNNTSCPCAQSTNSILNGVNLLSAPFTINRRFPEYLPIGVALPEYLNHSVTVQSVGALNAHTDVVICNNSTLEVINNGTVACGITSGTPFGSIVAREGSTIDINTTGVVAINSGSHITIESGAILKLRSNGKLIIRDGGTVLIEPGGKIIYESGAEIQLLGDNAVLEIQGTLEVGPNATFTFTYPNAASGFVRFKTAVPTGANIIAAPTSAITFSGADKNDKVLEVASGWVYPPDALSRFTLMNGKAELTAQSRLNIGCPLTIGNAAVFGGGLNVFGQSLVSIVNALFDQSGINAYLFYGKNRLSILNSTIRNGFGINTYGEGLVLNNVNLENNSNGWKGIGVETTSRPTQCNITGSTKQESFFSWILHFLPLTF